MRAHLRGAAGLLAGRLEPPRVPAARGLRLRRQPVQLHGDRREPDDVAGADGQHGRLEAGLDRDALRLLHDAAARGGGPARPASSTSSTGRGADDRRCRAREPRPRRRPLHRLDRRSSRACGRRSAATSSATATTRASSARPAARTSSSRTRPPTSTRSRPRSCAARSSTRARSARPPRGVYAPSNLWPELRERLAEEIATIKVGDVADFTNFMGAVIDASSLRDAARGDRGGARAPGHARSSSAAAPTTREGYFVEPTVIETRDPAFRLLRDELFGPVLTAYVYPEGEFEETLELVDRTAPYALTGAVFAEDRARHRARRRRRCATRPATSTSTTSRRARSSASSRSAARAPRARTTRPARCGT